MSDEREMLAEVVAQHAYDTGWRCSCDWTGSADEYDAHLADALLASPQFARLIAAAKAEALREAADRLLLRRLGSATANPWVEGWNHALEVCRDEIRAALTAEPDATEGEGA